jgi:DNA-binding response OmpR family regulator
MQDSRYQAPRAHILLVERNQGALELLETMLCWKGYQVTTAADGLDGLNKFHNGNFQLILTNLSTPKISGWELCRRVKNTEPSVPVALVTGLDFGASLDHSPFDVIFPEPFQFDEFQCLVDSLIQCRAAAEEKQGPKTGASAGPLDSEALSNAISQI